MYVMMRLYIERQNINIYMMSKMSYIIEFYGTG